MSLGVRRRQGPLGPAARTQPPGVFSAFPPVPPLPVQPADAAEQPTQQLVPEASPLGGPEARRNLEVVQQLISASTTVQQVEAVEDWVRTGVLTPEVQEMRRRKAEKDAVANDPSEAQGSMATDQGAAPSSGQGEQSAGEPQAQQATQEFPVQLGSVDEALILFEQICNRQRTKCRALLATGSLNVTSFSFKCSQ